MTSDARSRPQADDLLWRVGLEMPTIARMKIENAYVYIVKCIDGTYYVGSTIDLPRRIWEHNEGLGAVYTRSRRPVELVYSEQYRSVEQAFLREKQIQNWSRAKREALIEGRMADLPALAEGHEKRRRRHNRWHRKIEAEQTEREASAAEAGDQASVAE